MEREAEKTELTGFETMMGRFKNMVGSFLLALGLLSCATNSDQRNCGSETVELESIDFKVDVSRYGGQNSVKSIVILPPTGRTNYLDRSYAKIFCKAGFDTYIMDSWTGDEVKTTELEIHQRFYGQAQKAIGLVLSQIKSPYIGLLGTSVGGLHATIAASYQDRLQAVFVITGGISVAEVIVNSNQAAMVELRQDRQRRYGFKTADENIKALGNVFSFEPENLPQKFRQKDLGLSIALEDKTVPTANQLRLKEFWNSKYVITFPNNHFWTIVKSWLFKSDEILQFFEDSAKARSPQT